MKSKAFTLVELMIVIAIIAIIIALIVGMTNKFKVGTKVRLANGDVGVIMSTLTSEWETRYSVLVKGDRPYSIIVLSSDIQKVQEVERE